MEAIEFKTLAGQGFWKFFLMMPKIQNGMIRNILDRIKSTGVNIILTVTGCNAATYYGGIARPLHIMR